MLQLSLTPEELVLLDLVLTKEAAVAAQCAREFRNDEDPDVDADDYVAYNETIVQLCDKIREVIPHALRARIAPPKEPSARDLLRAKDRIV